jgi:putative sigma-54 modulation protein
MRVELHVKGMDAEDALREYVERRIHFALSRFGSELERVAIRLTKTDGSQGASQKQCQIVIRLLPSGSVSVVATHADLFGAIDRAVERAGQSVQRRFFCMRCFAR